MSFKITGLDKLQRDLEEAQRAFRSLDGTITTLKFNPADPKSVEEAIGKWKLPLTVRLPFIAVTCSFQRWPRVERQVSRKDSRTLQHRTSISAHPKPVPSRHRSKNPEPKRSSEPTPPPPSPTTNRPH